MTINTKLNLEEYRKLLFILTYRKPWTIFVTLFGFFMIAIGCVTYFGITNDTEKMTFQFVIGIILIFLTPYKVFATTKRNFNSNQRLQEEIEYEFTNEKMKIKGESFNSEFDWYNTNKIEELNNWFLIYQSSTTGNLIPKKNLSKTEIEQLRNIFNEQKNIKLKLKNN